MHSLRRSASLDSAINERKEHRKRCSSCGFDEVVQGMYHQFHFIGLSAIQNHVIEMPYAQIPPRPVVCAKPLEQWKKGTVVFTQPGNRIYREKPARFLGERYTDDMVLLTITFKGESINLNRYSKSDAAA